MINDTAYCGYRDDARFKGVYRAHALVARLQQIANYQAAGEPELIEPYADELSKALAECPEEEQRGMMLALGEYLSIVFSGSFTDGEEWKPFSPIVPSELKDIFGPSEPGFI